MDPESLISAVVTAVIGLAIIAVLVSQRANTASVIGASGSSLANVIGAAVSPVTGASSSRITIPTTASSGSTFSASFN